jgi:hypothetical protein
VKSEAAPSAREEVASEGAVAQRVGRWPSTARSHVASRRDRALLLGRARRGLVSEGAAARAALCRPQATLPRGAWLSLPSLYGGAAPGGRNHEHSCRREEGRPLCAFGVERRRRRVVDLQRRSVGDSAGL